RTSRRIGLDGRCRASRYRRRTPPGGSDTMTARLAVVDDDPAFTEFVQAFLRTRGYEVDVYHSGSALLEGLRTGAAPPNVILLDVLMPDLDGIETLRAI